MDLISDSNEVIVSTHFVLLSLFFIDAALLLLVKYYASNLLSIRISLRIL